MAGCFDPFRPRTHSFDLHLLMHRPKLNRISKLFRSRSETSVKNSNNSPEDSPVSSPKTTPKSATTVPKRRFMRVVRDGDSSGEEYENPHVIRKYSQKYAHTRYAMKKSQSLEEDCPLPYKVSGHTILKKHSSFEQSGHQVTESPDQSPPSSKHASFKNEVEVIEFDRKEKIQKRCCFTHREQLVIDDVDGNLRLMSVTSDCEVIQENAPCEMLDGEVFVLDEEDEESLNSDIVDEIPLPELPSDLPASLETDLPGLFRQLSSGSDDSSDSERPSQMKKTKLDNESETISPKDLSPTPTTSNRDSVDQHVLPGRSKEMEAEP